MGSLNKFKSAIKASEFGLYNFRMIEIRMVFAFSLLLQATISLECSNFIHSKKCYEQFNSYKNKFLDYKPHPPANASENDVRVSTLGLFMRSVCPNRDLAILKEINESVQDEISFDVGKSPYFRYHYLTERKKNQMFSFSSIIIEHACPHLHENQKAFRETIGKVDKIIEGWNTNALKKRAQKCCQPKSRAD